MDVCCPALPAPKLEGCILFQVLWEEEGGNLQQPEPRGDTEIRTPPKELAPQQLLPDA